MKLLILCEILAWYLLDESDRLYYLQRVQTLLPISLLASIKSTLLTSGGSLRGLFHLPILSWSSSNDAHLHKLQENMQKSMSSEEYEKILNHINSYVQKLVVIKIEEQEAQRAQRISPEQTQLIVQIMRENLERFAREKRDLGEVKLSALSETEVQRLAELVRLQLVASGWRPAHVQLTGENLAEIRKLVTEELHVHNHAYYTLLAEQLDLDALLGRILTAPQFADFVDARINSAVELQRLSVGVQEGSGQGSAIYERQQQLIDELNKEIAYMKLSFSDKQSENMALQQSVSKLQLSQDELMQRLQEHELSTDARFSSLLSEIELKLVALQDEQFTLFNKQIKLTLIEILGFKQLSPEGDKLSEADLQNWVRNVFVAKDYLEQRLIELNNQTNHQLKDEIDRSGMLLMRDISERLKKELLLVIETKQSASATELQGKISSALSEEEVRKIVKSVLAIYDADKTGLVDFALESAGGQILSTRCTESYQTKTAQISVFGIPLWFPSNTPRVAISPNVQPGECWAFQSFPGFLVLKLNSMVHVTGFTLEHIPKTLSPTGRIDSAPKNFTVWGLDHENDQEPVLFGEYEYLDNNAALQYFPVQNIDIKRPYEIVELRIETNHGNTQYTCLYRFRVHGKSPLA